MFHHVLAANGGKHGRVDGLGTEESSVEVKNRIFGIGPCSIYCTVASTTNVIYKKINIHGNMGRRGPTAVMDTFQHTLWYWYIHENDTVTDGQELFRHEFPNLEIYQQEPDFPSESTLRRAFQR
jgi:hypothetical protein